MATLGGGVVGAAAVHWHSRQKVDRLQQRLSRSEEARNGAIERSMHAREQLAQLSKAIAGLRKAHHTVSSSPISAPTTSADERRALAERALEAAQAHDARSATSGKGGLFANTEPMQP